LRRRPLLDTAALEQAIGARLGKRNLLVTFHPVTLDEDNGLAELEELLAALGGTGASTALWITRPNADTGGCAIAARLDRFASEQGSRVRLHTSLGSLRYLSLMARMNAVVGNSSSGLYEAPSLGVPTVGVGDRQRGRLAATSVLRCAPQRDAIAAAIDSAMAMDCRGTVNPYGDGHSAARIVALLRAMPERAALLRKPFHAL
jgi:UDP-hydrolysing UDP-N-acetyl-D-glucosamine 2-epimerase